MRERALKAIQPKTYVPRTSDGRADKPSPNLLLGQALPATPDQVWAGDITYIPTSAGWLYLAVVIDLCSRKIIGWALADHLRTQLAVDALKQALGTRSTTQKPIFHSDRANPYHNAWTESFMGTLKAEMLDGGSFINAHDARIEIFSYIDTYYNTHRKHSSLDYQTPAQFEAAILTQN